MKPSVEKLHKYFKLEAERGYDNRAVMGGLENMLLPWEAEARADNLPEEIIQAVVTRLRDYPRLSPDSRAEALKGIWKRVTREMSQDEPSSAIKISVKPAPLPEIEKSHVKPAEPQPGEEALPAKPEAPASPETVTEITAVETKDEEETAVEEPTEPAALNAPITVLHGIGPRHAQTLQRLGLHTLGDMLYHFPHRYDDYSQLKPINRVEVGESVTIIGTVENVDTRSIHNRKMHILETIINDGSGSIRLTWFNQPWIAKRLKTGTQIVVSGKIDQYLGRMTMNNPSWELLEQQHLHTNRIVPIYPLTARITQRWLRRQMNQVVSYWSPRVQDWIPEAIREELNLLDLREALLQIHFPNSWKTLEAARYRLSFDEIFLLQLGVLRQKRAWQERTTEAIEQSPDWWQKNIDRLPYNLTNAQLQALESIKSDLESGRPMNRLLQGDVGSGKTVIAALAMSAIIQTNAQAALMAPTSILAEQHFQTLQTLLSDGENGVHTDSVRLLIGATPDDEKQEIREGLASGDVKLLVGTHALIEDPVVFNDLEMIVIDEQHRFGVKQRATLRGKGTNPHLLVMTATPIPRSLALTIYGDLDLSVIDEMPPGRQEIKTHVLLPTERERAFVIIRNHVENGHQAFIIYPLVEESEKVQALAAVEEYERLSKEIFPDYHLGLLHGRLKADEKEDVMTRFRNGELQVLVSTSVVEVGVDIPNATVMLIEGANRFGLSQLHQFRGRIGRGSHPSICLLIAESSDETENERLIAMIETNDGFILAERDLEQRGPGEFLGTRQSGFTDLRLANLTDLKIIESARQQAHQLLDDDPSLQSNEHQLLSIALDAFWNNGKGDVS